MGAVRGGPKYGLDSATAGQALSGPGMDTRSWCSMGTVVDEHLFEWDADFGCEFVTVSLQPSKKTVRCRVLKFVAGQGEGESYPWMPGDEVLVAIPEGNERAGCVILGRLNNGTDKAPTNVAGQDPSKNSFGYRSMKAPFITECAGPWVVRSSVAGSFIGLDDKGQVTIRDGQGAGLQLAPDHFSYSGPGANGPMTAPDCLLQLDVTNRRFTLQAGDAVFTICGSQASPQANAINVPSGLIIQTGGNAAQEHAVSTEAVFNIVVQTLNALSVVLAAAGAVPVVGGAVPVGAFLAAFLNQAASSSTFLPIAALASAGTSLVPTLGAAIQAGFLAMSAQKPPATPGPGQLSPGLGSPATFIG